MFGIIHFEVFALACVALWLTPGPDTMYILARTVSQGKQAGIQSAVGIGGGAATHTVLMAFGLSAVLATSPVAFKVVRLAGAFYLLYLGIGILRSARKMETRAVQEASRWDILRQGYLTNLFNPKVALFFMAFLPQFVRADRNAGAIPFLLLGAFFTIGGTLYCMLLVTIAARATRVLREKPSVSVWLARATGSLYIALAAGLIGTTFFSRKPRIN